MRQPLSFFLKTTLLAAFLYVSGLIGLCVPTPASALIDRQKEMEALCDAPCAQYQVPKELVLAIARQESGCHPWIINISGKDYRPKDREEALQYAYAAYRAGRSFDVGLMQVNVYWIKKYRWPLELVIDPANNVKIGTWILAQEIQRHGLNWKAVASYHTPLKRNFNRGVWYARSIVGHLKNIMGGN